MTCCNANNECDNGKGCICRVESLPKRGYGEPTEPITAECDRHMHVARVYATVFFVSFFVLTALLWAYVA